MRETPCAGCWRTLCAESLGLQVCRCFAVGRAPACAGCSCRAISLIYWLLLMCTKASPPLLGALQVRVLTKIVDKSKRSNGSGSAAGS